MEVKSCIQTIDIKTYVKNCKFGLNVIKFWKERNEQKNNSNDPIDKRKKTQNSFLHHKQPQH